MGSGGGGGGRLCGRCGVLGKAVKWIGEKIFGSSKGTGSAISKQDSYDEENAQLSEIVTIQNTLLEFRTRCEKACDSLEEDALLKTRESIDELFDFLKEINDKNYSGKKLGLNLRRLERENRNTEDIIRGYIKKSIQKRVSLDDEECKRILKLPAGAEKEKEMTNFLNTVLKEGLKEVIKRVKKSLKEQYENIEDQIQDRLSSYESMIEDKQKQLHKVADAKEKDEAELENHLMELAYIQSLCSLGLEQLD